MGVEEDVKKGVEACRKWDNHQKDKLNDFRTDEGEVQQRGEGQEGHRAVQNTVGEEQESNVLHHGTVPHILQVSLFQIAVELGVGNGHDEEAKGIEQDESHHVACGAGLAKGQRQAEGGGAVPAATEQGHHGDGEGQCRAEPDDCFQTGKRSFRFEFRRAFHREPTLQGGQSQQENR